jgi:hypothetical protein
MNEIEAAVFILYPHLKKAFISFVSARRRRIAAHPDDTRVLAVIWDEGDGKVGKLSQRDELRSY